MMERCWFCNGKGKILSLSSKTKEVCESCDGAGRVMVEDEIIAEDEDTYSFTDT